MSDEPHGLMKATERFLPSDGRDPDQATWEVANALLRVLHQAPHGPELPDRMPHVGDFFVKEELDGTGSLYVWQGKWMLGTTGLRKVDGTYDGSASTPSP